MQGKQTAAALTGYVSPPPNYKSDGSEAEVGKPKSKKIFGFLIAALMLVATVAILYLTGLLEEVIDAFGGNDGESTNAPTVFLTAEPTSSPSPSATRNPTVFPTRSPGPPPTASPTLFPTGVPTKFPTDFPTRSPTNSPASDPTFEPTSSPTAENDQNLFPIETREGDDHVGLYLLNVMQEEAFEAFKSAASRWSAIVDGSVASPGTVPAGSDFCGLLFEEDTFLDHLIIGAQVAPIDGVGGILGQAGPCALIDLPLLGIMTFDSADIAELIAEGAIEPVILHEMGHVLGIGTLWRFFGLLQDPVLNEDGTLNNANNQPKMIGANAVGEYRNLTGNSVEQFVPVEDGTVGGVDLFVPKTSGAGSIDGHWDEDFLPGELMEFRIDPSGPSPPLSATSIASLADFGYVVDVSLADAYSVSTARAQRLRGVGSKTYLMVDDVLKINPVILKPAH